jgi:hypothetical protein
MIPQKKIPLYRARRLQQSKHDFFITRITEGTLHELNAVFLPIRVTCLPAGRFVCKIRVIPFCHITLNVTLVYFRPND